MEQQKQIKVDLNDAKSLNCSNCKSPAFIQMIFLKQLPEMHPFVATTGNSIIPVEQLVCAQCGKPFDPNEIKNEEKKSSLIIQ